MEQDPKRPANGGPSANGLLLLVTLLAGALLVRQLPLTDSRPSAAEPKAYSYLAADIDARLWEDPIGAVARGIRDYQQRTTDHPDIDQGDHSSACMARELAERSRGGALPQPVFVGVMVPGGAYPGYAEWRRRARYAVLSGLKEFGYAPNDPEHLGYFTLDTELRDVLDPKFDSKGIPAAQFFAYEWFDRTGSSSPASGAAAVAAEAAGADHRLLVIWLDQGLFADNTVDRIDHLFGYLLGRNGAATGVDKCPRGAAEAQPGARKPRVIILGPGDSTMLKHMAEQAAANPPPQRANDLHFYDYAATAPDADLLPKSSEGTEPTNLHQFFAARNLAVFRTIGDDQQLACTLRDELALRGISGPAATSLKDPPPVSPEVVLIAEWDTDYGRALAGITKDVLTGAARCLPGGNGTDDEVNQIAHAWSGKYWVDTYTYLRGVDGRLPGRQAEAGGKSGVSGGGSNDDKGPTSSAGDDKRIERAEGQGQLDYLRRLALRLHTLDASARAQGQNGIRAIGVMGSDVYDKLLVLQVLRPAFPYATFFTTDLDARLLHPLEFDWTRNLLVASNFGLALAPGLQSGIAPFRDAYQTSLYLSTLIALTNAASARCHVEPGSGTAHCPVDQPRIDAWRTQPRLFEIGRLGPFDLSGGALRRSEGAGVPVAGVEGSCDAIAALRDCATVQPKAPGLVAEPSPYARRISFVVLAVALIALAMSAGAGQRIRDWAIDPAAGPYAKIPRQKQTKLLAAGLFVLVLLLGMTYAMPSFLRWLTHFLTEDGRGVPLTLLDGVSIWPTELIRAFGLVLAGWLIYHGWRKLDANIDYVSEQMLWQSQRAALVAEVDAEYAGWKWWQRFLHVFSFRLNWERNAGRRADGSRPEGGGEPPPLDPATGLRPEAEEFWRKYIYQGRLGARLCRIGTAVALYFLFALAVAAVFGFPETAIRGVRGRTIDAVLVLVAVLTTQFLIFSVVDATILCRQFVMAISRRRLAGGQAQAFDFDRVSATTRWPDPTLEHFAGKLKIDKRFVDQWVTIHVIGLRTKAVSRLIFYPYLVLSLIIIARSPIFDNWAMPVALKIILGTSVLIVTVGAILLRSAAEYARRKVVWRLSNELIPLNSANAADQHAAKQVEGMIAQINKYNTGSFASYLNQPVVRAILLPLGSVGGVSLLQYLTIWNF